MSDYAEKRTASYIPRQPLGLPRGTIRAILAGCIVGLFCLLLWLPADTYVKIPLFLYGLTGVVMMFFVMHLAPRPRAEVAESVGNWVGQVLFRVMLLGAVAATIILLYLRNPELLRDRLTPSPEQMKSWTEMLLCVGGGFMIGYLLSITPLRSSSLFQDVVAWLSNLAILGLVVCVLIYAVIKPTMAQDWDPVGWECGMAAVISFYFGSRSGS
jgi:hypothetical protein